MKDTTTIIICISVVVIVLHAISSYYMSQAALLKGYGDEYHIWPICFFLGIPGFLYVLSLPDKKLQKQNEDILNALKGNGQETVSDELPEL